MIIQATDCKYIIHNKTKNTIYIVDVVYTVDQDDPSSVDITVIGRTGST